MHLDRQIEETLVVLPLLTSAFTMSDRSVKYVAGPTRLILTEANPNHIDDAELYQGPRYRNARRCVLCCFWMLVSLFVYIFPQLLAVYQIRNDYYGTHDIR